MARRSSRPRVPAPIRRMGTEVLPDPRTRRARTRGQDEARQIDAALDEMDADYESAREELEDLE